MASVSQPGMLQGRFGLLQARKSHVAFRHAAVVVVTEESRLDRGIEIE